MDGILVSPDGKSAKDQILLLAFGSTDSVPGRVRSKSLWFAGLDDIEQRSQLRQGPFSFSLRPAGMRLPSFYLMAIGCPGEPVAPLSGTGMKMKQNLYALSLISSSKTMFSRL